jgi:hypothetical protein
MNIRVTPRAQQLAHTLAYRPVINRAALRGEAAAKEMAEDLRLFIFNIGCATEADLEILGWTKAQMALHGARAREIANARSAG